MWSEFGFQWFILRLTKNNLFILLLIPKNAFETAGFWYIVGLTGILRLSQRKNFTFLVVRWKMAEPWKLLNNLPLEG